MQEHLCNPTFARLVEQQVIVEGIIRAHYLALLIARRGIVAESASRRPDRGLSWPRNVGLGADKPLWRDGDHA